MYHVTYKTLTQRWESGISLALSLHSVCLFPIHCVHPQVDPSLLPLKIESSVCVGNRTHLQYVLFNSGRFLALITTRLALGQHKHALKTVQDFLFHLNWTFMSLICSAVDQVCVNREPPSHTHSNCVNNVPGQITKPLLLWYENIIQRKVVWLCLKIA